MMLRGLLQLQQTLLQRDSVAGGRQCCCLFCKFAILGDQTAHSSRWPNSGRVAALKRLQNVVLIRLVPQVSIIISHIGQQGGTLLVSYRGRLSPEPVLFGNTPNDDDFLQSFFLKSFIIGCYLVGFFKTTNLPCQAVFSAGFLEICLMSGYTSLPILLHAEQQLWSAAV